MELTHEEALAKQWIDAKHAEGQAKALRIDIEERLKKFIQVPDDGSKSSQIGSFRVTVTQHTNRTLDDNWEEVIEAIPQQFRPISYSPKIDTKGIKWLKENEPGYWQILSRAITEKPAKTNFKIVYLDDDIPF